MLSLKQSVFFFVLGLLLIICVLYLLLVNKELNSREMLISFFGISIGLVGCFVGLGKIIIWLLKKTAKSDKIKQELQTIETETNKRNNIEGFILGSMLRNWYGQYIIYADIIVLSVAPIFFLLLLWTLINNFTQHKTIELIVLILFLTKISIIFSYVIQNLIVKNKKSYRQAQESNKIIADYENQQANLINIINYLNITTGFSHHSLKNASVIIDGMIKNIEVGDVIKEEDKRDLILGVDNLWRAIEDFNTFGKPKGEVNYPIETLINAIHLLHKVKTKKFEFAIIYQNIDKTTKLNVEWHDAYQMIDNLLINAYDAVATTEIKKVSLIISSSKDNFISIIVADTGEGIPKYYQDKLFVLGFTTKTTPNIKRGTGLTHIKYLAEKNNGKVVYKTTNQEYSTIFELLLPISK